MKKELTEVIDPANAAQTEDEIRAQSAEPIALDIATRAKNELELEAADENLAAVQAFVEECLAPVECSPGAKMQIDVAVEEVFINIAHYAYAPDKGKATVRVEVSGDPAAVTITFTDHGMPYDPLARADPDLTLSAEEREAGGLGILLTKKLMDDVSYEYRDGQNILTLKKNIK